MCVFWSFTATPLVTICPRVSQDRDVRSKLHREEVVLELQRPAVEMSGWQRWQSRMLPEVPERVWGELPSSVGKLPRATIHTSSNTNKQKRWRRKNIGFHWPGYWSLLLSFHPGEVFCKEERLPKIQREDGVRRFHTCWRPQAAFLTRGLRIIWTFKVTDHSIHTRSSGAGQWRIHQMLSV